MRDLIIIVPTRDRPHAVAELAATFQHTTEANTSLWLAVDSDDAHLNEYRDAIIETGTDNITLFVASPPETMVSALNAAATRIIETEKPYSVGFMGDDHRPRTHGWDRRYVEALHQLGTGIVYGNDLIQGAWLPTQCAMTADIIKCLGWMCYPGLRHLYVDDFWKYLGGDANCLTYLPDVVIEHVHPIRTGNWDSGYERVNSSEMYDADKLTFNWIMSSGTLKMSADKIRGLRENNG